VEDQPIEIDRLVVRLLSDARDTPSLFSAQEQELGL